MKINILIFMQVIIKTIFFIVFPIKFSSQWVSKNNKNIYTRKINSKNLNSVKINSKINYKDDNIYPMF